MSSNSFEKLFTLVLLMGGLLKVLLMGLKLMGSLLKVLLMGLKSMVVSRGLKSSVVAMGM